MANADLLESNIGNLKTCPERSADPSRTQLRKVNGSRIRTTTGWPCLRAGANRQFCTADIASSANEEAVAIMGRTSLVAPSAVTLNSTTA